MNNKAKKLFVSCALTFITVSAVVSPVALAEGQSAKPGFAATQSISPRAEETKTYYRTLANGQVQYRVWSITQGKWLTDWTNL